MQGYEALWLPGMDHASIAVHALVEKALLAEGHEPRELGRGGVPRADLAVEGGARRRDPLADAPAR
jgi:hypothetical protein